MKFVDEVRIQVKAGDGGHGAVAFRREKYVEKGGPSGGDGGNGGSVIFVANPQLTTLLDYRFLPIHHARNGEHGMGSDCNGKNAEDLVLQLPNGTVVRDEATGEVIVDLSTPGERFVIAKGGRGGLGNMNFATSTRQTPRFAQDGTPGEAKSLVLELKLLADVGIIGFPNAGKSTLISRISRAKPKIADYPFTTLVPNLGVVQYKDGLSFVAADIPGLIEGAADGVGLGIQFLRHVERCKVLVHLVDLSAVIENRDPVHDFEVINKELARYSPELARRPQIVVANKLDLPFAREAFPAFEKAMKKKKLEVLQLSGVTGEGLQAVVDRIAQALFAKTPEKVRARARHDEKPAPAKTLPAKPLAAKPKKSAAAAPEGKLTQRKALRARENPNKGKGAKKLTAGRQRPERKKSTKKRR